MLAGIPLAPYALSATATSAPTEVMVTIDGTAYRSLQRDMEGEDVLRLKQRMQMLGFFKAGVELTDHLQQHHGI